MVDRDTNAGTYRVMSWPNLPLDKAKLDEKTKKHTYEVFLLLMEVTHWGCQGTESAGRCVT